MVSEDFYKAAIQNAPIGYALHRVILDPSGIPADYEYLEVNPAFCRIAGLESCSLKGKRVTELLPDIRSDSFDWIAFYGGIALNGGSESFEHYSEALGRWYRGVVFSPERGLFITMFSDATEQLERVRALETAIDARQRLLSKTESLLKLPFGSENYQRIVEDLREITGAALVVLNLDLEEEAESGWARTAAVAGDAALIGRVEEMLGHPIGGRPHQISEDWVRRIQRDELQRFESLGQLMASKAPAAVIREIEEALGIGPIYTRGILERETPVGELVIAMPTGVDTEDMDSAEIYLWLAGMMLARWRDEESLLRRTQLLEESEHRFRMLFDDAPIPIIIADVKTMKVGYVNPATLEMFGFTEAEILSRNVLDLHAEASRQAALKEFGAVASGGKTVTDDLVCVRKDGTEFYVSINAVRIDLDGRSSVLGYVTDVTERRQMEDALKAERALFVGGPALVALWENDAGRTFEYASENFLSVLGYDAEALVQERRSYLELIHPEDRDRVREEYERNNEARMAYYEQEYRLLKADGSYRWYYDFTVPRRDAKGRLRKLHGYLLDITESRNLRESLKRQVESERMVAEISSSLVSVDPETIRPKIQSALRVCGEFFRADRTYVFQYQEDGTAVTNTYEWCAPGVSSQIGYLQEVPVAEYPWWQEELLTKGIVCVDDIDHLPEAAANEKRFLETYGTKALVCLPMQRNEGVIGMVGFETAYEPRVWNEEEVALLRILCNIINDAINRFDSEMEVLHLSYHDKLTDLYNRRFFEEELHRLDTARMLPLTVIIGDVNGLKVTNDVYGHAEGDRLLKTIGRILHSVCREDDIVARWGGDEFVILLPKTEGGAAKGICKRIEEACDHVDTLPVKASIALGYSTKYLPEEAISQVIGDAEDWMYKKKLLSSEHFRSSMVRTLIQTLSDKHFESPGHSDRMKQMSLRIGEALALPENQIEMLVLLAILHDIGKAIIKEDVMNKPGRLSPEEWTSVKKHAENGYHIALASSRLGQIADLILCHHERWDGSGYPGGLKGEEIPIISRILAVLDAYDVMTNEQRYKQPMTPKDALAEIRRCAGTQFDPQIAELFVGLMENG